MFERNNNDDEQCDGCYGHFDLNVCHDDFLLMLIMIIDNKTLKAA